MLNLRVQKGMSKKHSSFHYQTLFESMRYFVQIKLMRTMDSWELCCWLVTTQEILIAVNLHSKMAEHILLMSPQCQVTQTMICGYFYIFIWTSLRLSSSEIQYIQFQNMNENNMLFFMLHNYEWEKFWRSNI